MAGRTKQPALGRNIRIARIRKGYSLPVLSKMIRKGKSQLSEWENDKGEPRLSTLAAIAKALGVSIDQLLLGEDAYAEKMKAEWEPKIADLQKQIDELRAARK